MLNKNDGLDKGDEVEDEDGGVNDDDDENSALLMIMTSRHSQGVYSGLTIC